MAKPNEITTDTSAREIVSVRIINAPRALVFKVWTHPEHVIHWWGPTGFTNTFYEMEVKPGGVWRFMMHGPDGTDYPNKITFREVVSPERLVFDHGSDEEPMQFHVTVTFEEQGDQTKLTMRMLFPSAAARDKVVKEYGAIEGNKQTLDKLEEYLTTIL